MRENFSLNNVDIEVTRSDAIQLQYNHREDPFTVIDLDPYGSVAVFLDGAVQAVENGGLLCLTSTDMATLCGHH